MNKLDRKEKIELLIIIPIVLLLGYLSTISKDIQITIIILSASIFLFLFALKSRFDLLLKTISLFVFFHLIVFPYIYVFMIKLDSKAFRVDSEIEKNELIIVEHELTEKYDLKFLAKGEEIALKLINSENTYLDSLLDFLNNNNILIIDSLMLHSSSPIFVKVGHDEEAYSTLSVCDRKGCNIFNFTGHLSNKLTLKEFLNNEVQSIKKSNTDLSLEIDKIKEKDIWSYRRILAYSINIFETDNLKPKTKIANIIFFIHKFLVAIFILGIIGTSFYEFLIEGKRK